MQGGEDFSTFDQLKHLDPVLQVGCVPQRGSGATGQHELEGRVQPSRHGIPTPRYLSPTLTRLVCLRPVDFRQAVALVPWLPDNQEGHSR